MHAHMQMHAAPHASACVHVFIGTTDETEQCCRQEDASGGSGAAAGNAVSLITKQTTTGLLPHRMDVYVLL